MNEIFPEELLPFWIDMAPGAFHVSSLSRSVDVQQLLVDKLERLVNRGHLEHYGDKRGWYIPKQSILVELDYINESDEPADIWLPFAMSDLIEIHPGNVIIISGAPNSGKTAIMLNMIKENRSKEWDIHYFSSEMGGGELKKRLKKWPDIGLDQWGFKAYRRSENFHDVVISGHNTLNFIDFLEVHTNFYEIGQKIKRIHDALNGSIAIIGLQKNPHVDTGLGGYRTLEVTRLAIAVDHGKIKIVKAKNWRCTENPNGLQKSFKLVDGYKIIDRHGWYRETE